MTLSLSVVNWIRTWYLLIGSFLHQRRTEPILRNRSQISYFSLFLYGICFLKISHKNILYALLVFFRLDTLLGGFNARNKRHRCVMMDEHGRWLTTSCQERAAYLCEKPYKKRLIKKSETIRRQNCH